MNPVVAVLWERAQESLQVARSVYEASPDTAASRAYYAAFYALSALFQLEGRRFRKHTGIEAAVHRDLVKTGRWSAEMGEKYTKLRVYRNLGDYGELIRVTPVQAQAALEASAEILEAVARERPDSLPLT